MKWGETAHRGGFKLEEPPPLPCQKQSWTCICLSGGKSTFYLGVGWGGVSWAWSGDHTNWCPSGFRAVHGFWGVECWVRWGERSTSKLYPYSLLSPDRICGKSSGSDNEVDLVCRWLLQGLSSVTTGSWARGTQQPPCPVFKDQHDPLLCLPVTSWAAVAGVCWCLTIPLHLGGRSHLGFSLGLPQSSLGKEDRSFWAAGHRPAVWVLLSQSRWAYIQAGSCAEVAEMAGPAFPLWQGVTGKLWAGPSHTCVASSFAWPLTHTLI